LNLSWRKLNKQLALLPEDQVLSLLNAERGGARRISILQRLHQRYTMLRAERERQEILREARAP
jgi:hypothetical protein